MRAIIGQSNRSTHSFFYTLRALPFAIAVLASAALPAPGMADARSMDAREELLQQGEYIARAANCLSCHGEDLAGGYEVNTPLGNIVATNISPSIEFGIGNYTSDEFARAIREGVAPSHRLYPAMPYASYVGMSNEDVNALYAWTMSRPAVDESPQQQTELPFPFNIRLSMVLWNAFFLDESERFSREQSMTERGSYLVNHLGHCGECHTPRNALYGPDSERYLAGALVDGWLAPNLTSDAMSGIGAWTEDALVEYLQTGYAGDIAQAAGSMNKVVQHGTRFLETEDLRAVAAYLMSVEPISDPTHTRVAFRAPGERNTAAHTYNQIREEMSAALARDNPSTIEQVYLSECASCHGVNGQGQPEAYYPPLVDNLELRRADPTNVVQSIAKGIKPGGLYRTPGMPGFSDTLSHEEIAELVNHLRKSFGGLDDSAVMASDVDRILNEQPEPPMFIRLAPLLAWTGIILFVLLPGFVVWRVFVRRCHAVDAHEPLPSSTPTRPREQEA